MHTSSSEFYRTHSILQQNIKNYIIQCPKLNLMDKEEEDNYSQEISTDNSVDVVNFMAPPQNQISSLDKFSFADVMHFADFGPKLGLNQSNYVQNESDNSNYYNFNLVNDHHNIEEGPSCGVNDQNNDNNNDNSNNVVNEIKNVKRKRGRSVKTSEEVESQRMTHIAVERNRRRQMNEHLLVLRSLMPSSYVQRGDQASIVGGAIEFVKELEQLLQCLESQKRRRLYGDISEPGPLRSVTDPHPIVQQPYFPPLPIIPNCDMNSDVNNHEDAAENKSFIADIEVKMIGFDAVIKVLSRRRQAQLVKIIEALEDMQFDVVHTNITTIDQTVLYSFNVKIAVETRCTAEYIANSVHQILSFIDTSTI